MNAGKALKQIMVDLNVTGATLARRIGVSPQQVTRWRQQPDMQLSSLVRICTALDVKPAAFIVRANALD